MFNLKILKNQDLNYSKLLLLKVIIHQNNSDIFLKKALKNIASILSYLFDAFLKIGVLFLMNKFVSISKVTFMKYK